MLIAALLLICTVAASLLLMKRKPFHGHTDREFRRIDHHLNRAYAATKKP